MGSSTFHKEVRRGSTILTNFEFNLCFVNDEMGFLPHSSLIAPMKKKKIEISFVSKDTFFLKKKEKYIIK